MACGGEGVTSEDVDDIFDAIFMKDNQSEREGFQEGLNVGKERGQLEGCRLGVEKGFDIGAELGFYLGFALEWGNALKSEGTGKNEKHLKHLKDLGDLSETFDFRDPGGETFAKALLKLRTKFKMVCSLLKVDVDSSSGAGNTGIDF